VTDGTNLCNVVEGVVQNCTPLVNDMMVLSSMDGSVETGFAIVIAPYLLGVGIGGIMSLISKAR
tara:strand:+ start:6043 stop:6234 length:192 start_codon:yes stop_codon:yes gene_type:complete